MSLALDLANRASARISDRRFGWLSRLVSYSSVGYVIAVVDFILIVGSSIGAGAAYQFVFLGYIGEISDLAGIGANSAVLFVLFANSLGLYKTPGLLSGARQFRGTSVCWALMLLITVALLFLLKLGASYSRGATLCFGVFGICLLLTFRRFVQVALPRALSRGMVSAGRSVLIGERDEMAGSSADHLLEKFGMREVGRFELPPDGESAPLLRVTDAAIQVTRDDRAEIVLLAMRWDDHIRRDLVCERLRILPVPILLLPDRSVGTILSRPTHEIGTQIMVELQRAPLSWVEMALKRAVDLVVTATALVLLSPLLAATAWAIKLDSRGPAIFRQRRRGFSGREFTIYKFRTMHVLESGPTIRQAKRGDARVTRLGRMLRSTSIDELPQLLNVLNGEMSIIGPRPHAVAHDGEYGQLIANYAFRHHVKPGLTGWAQIHGFRGETARLELMKRRVDLDLWYIDNWSLWLDLKIMARTFVELMRDPNAY